MSEGSGHTTTTVFSHGRELPTGLAAMCVAIFPLSALAFVTHPLAALFILVLRIQDPVQAAILADPFLRTLSLLAFIGGWALSTISLISSFGILAVRQWARPAMFWTCVLLLIALLMSTVGHYLWLFPFLDRVYPTLKEPLIHWSPTVQRVFLPIIAVPIAIALAGTMVLLTRPSTRAAFGD
jgi:hypothetical protein